MVPQTHTHASLQTYRRAPIELGEPDVLGRLAVHPLLGVETTLTFRSFAEGSALGVSLGELPGGASVNDLLIHNPLEVGVLLYDGEEVLGAQQNRTFDTTVLVPAGAKLRVPVSCVEAGRWDGGRHGEGFSPSPQAAYPELRRQKNAAARAAAIAGEDGRADQQEVWDEVARRSQAFAVQALTGAMHDLFTAREDVLAEAAAAIVRRPGQLGALATLDGRPLVCDWVGRADVYAALHGPLVRGYALDALAPAVGMPGTVTEASDWLAELLGTHGVRRPSPGQGDALHYASGTAVGSGLVVDGELVQFCGFPAERPQARSVRRPSRRR